MKTLDDLIEERCRELEVLRAASRRIVELELELESTRLNHEGERYKLALESWRQMEGLYLIRKDGFTRVSESTEWTRRQLAAWLRLAPRMDLVADAILQAVREHGFVPAEMARAVLAALARDLETAP